MHDAVSLSRLDAMGQADLCRRGEVSARELRDAALSRIESLDPLLRSVVTIDREPPAPAEGPLRGVPFVVKDSTPWPDLRWSMGSRLFRANVARQQTIGSRTASLPYARDARSRPQDGPGALLARQQTPYGRRLVESGLVCVGKSAMSELGLLGSTETLLEGITHNPWSLSRSAAGSSGGSAVAVAAGLVPIAHANDGGGSIRVPAAACGVFGFKPSRGRTVPASLGRNDFLDITSDHCITRSVRDSALFLSLTEDHTTSRSVGFVRDPVSRSLRVAAWHRTMLDGAAEPEIVRAHEATIALLGELGHEVVPIEAPRYQAAQLSEAFFVVAGAAVASVVDTIDSMRGTPVQEDELEPFSWALVELFRAGGPDALPRARAAFADAVRVYRAATAGFDVVLTPTLATETWPLGHLSPVLARETLIERTGRAVGYTPMANIAGCPAMSVPLHTSTAGLPIGAHLAAAAGEDALLLSLAYQLERARPWADRWPPYSIHSLAR